MGKVDDWIAWLRHVEDDVNGLLLSRIVYKEIGEIVRANPAIEEPNHFYDFLARTYADHLSAGIRRQLDLDKRTHSKP